MSRRLLGNSTGFLMITESPLYQLIRTQRGSVLVESSVSLLVFLLVLLVGIDLIRVCYLSVCLQYGAATGARYASLLQSDPASTHAESIRRRISESSFIEVQLGQLQFCLREDDGSCTPLTASDIGNTSDRIKMRVDYSLNTIIGGFQIPLTAAVAYRNEPFRIT